MTVTMIALGVIVMGAVTCLAALPILTERQLARQAKQHYAEQYILQDVRSRYELLLHSVLDLDNDYDMGKISSDVYAEQRKMLIGRSVYLRKQLEQLEETSLLENEDALEAMIDMRRIERTAQREADIEAQVAAMRDKVKV